MAAPRGPISIPTSMLAALMLPCPDAQIRAISNATRNNSALICRWEIYIRQECADLSLGDPHSARVRGSLAGRSTFGKGALICRWEICIRQECADLSLGDPHWARAHGSLPARSTSGKSARIFPLGTSIRPGRAGIPRGGPVSGHSRRRPVSCIRGHGSGRSCSLSPAAHTLNRLDYGNP
jgi:hypothetical protein